MMLSVLFLISGLLNNPFYDLEKTIIPLESNREQIERILGPPNEKNCTECVYQTDKEKILINYSKKECEGELVGWNVSKDTVLSFSVTPFEKIKKADVIKNKSDYLVFTQHDFTNKYIDRVKGRVYIFDEFDILTKIIYLPTEDDGNKKRCKCFSKYNVAGVVYSPVRTFGNTDIDYGKTVIGNHLLDLKESKANLLTYLIVYSGDNIDSAEFKKYLFDLKNYIYETLKTNSGDLKIIEGGIKDEFMIDIFSVPQNYPEPVASLKSENCSS